MQRTSYALALPGGSWWPRTNRRCQSRALGALFSLLVVFVCFAFSVSLVKLCFVFGAFSCLLFFVVFQDLVLFAFVVICFSSGGVARCCSCLFHLVVLHAFLVWFWFSSCVYSSFDLRVILHIFVAIYNVLKHSSDFNLCSTNNMYMYLNWELIVWFGFNVDLILKLVTCVFPFVFTPIKVTPISAGGDKTCM